MTDRPSELKTLAEKARVFFSDKHAARERALQLSRSTIQLSSTAIRAVHRNEYDEARELIRSAGERVAEMKDIQIHHPDIYYTGFVQDAQKEYVEANATLAFITGAPLPYPEELGISYGAYLNGLGETIGEMRRYLLDSLRRADVSRCEELLDLMDNIYTELFTMDFPEAITGGLRRTTDAMRGILERTRGDLTTALRQQSLEERLTQLLSRVAEQELAPQLGVVNAGSAHQQLQEMGFRPVGRNPIWYTSVVISMLIQPGVQYDIDARAHEVARSLGWTVDRPYSNQSHPCFHFGHEATRNYFLRDVKNPRIGANHSLDKLEPFCYTHQRSWKNSESTSGSCTKACEYGIRVSG